MLASVTVRNIVLIESLHVEFHSGLCALTGETGAGKSILLDALGLATGMRGDRALIRHGAENASASAEFLVPADHPARMALAESGIASGDEPLILRRQISVDGRGRAYVNDQAVSVALLQQVGALLLEIHGQHDERGLLNPAGHRSLLDAFGRLEAEAEQTAAAYCGWRTAAEAAEEQRAQISEARRDADYLTHALEELDALEPQQGEEAALVSERALMMNAEKIAADLQEADNALSGESGLEGRLSAALRRLERAAPQAEGQLDRVTAALDRALVEAGEARAVLAAALSDLEFEPDRLEKAEERLFALRALARKHSCQVDSLPALRGDMAARLEALHTGEGKLKDLEAAAEKARADFLAAAEMLSERRAETAARLDKDVARELRPLKLDRARFRTSIDVLGEDRQGPDGKDRVRFEVATNPGAPFGELKQIASGGELSRFILALKVALAAQGTAATLIFDEVDRGVGGAVADAVGERLARLAEAGAQVLVVTHSPQVAARAGHHWRIDKAQRNGAMITTVAALDETGRREEIARMLAGAEVTDEARAAAERLLHTDDKRFGRRRMAPPLRGASRRGERA